MSIKELLNLVKWQLYMRLPDGGIYEKCKDRSVNNNKDSLTNVFNGNYLNKSIPKMYFEGYYDKDPEQIFNFYKNMFASEKVSFIHEDNCSDKEKNYGFNYIKFKFIDREVKIPAPNFSNKNEILTYRFELLDLIIPYFFTNNLDFNNLSFNEGPYEYVSNKVNVTLDKEYTILDLGANFGIFSAFAASKGCKVYAFEPYNYVIDYYLEKIKMIYPNVEIISKGVSNKTNDIKYLNINDNNTGGSFISELQIDDNFQMVNTITLDDFVSENNLNRVDFIKADIEGSELEMLEGAKYVLKYFHPRLSICKYHKLGDLKQIKKLIEEANSNYSIDTRWKKIYAEDKEGVKCKCLKL